MEHPIVDVPFIMAYDRSDVAYPIIGVLKDPRDTSLPAANSLLVNPEWAARYPNNKFRDVAENPNDRRVIWVYRILPSTVLSGSEFDPVTGDLLPMTVQTVVAGSTGLGLQDNGIYITINPKDATTSEQVTRTAVGADLLVGQTWIECRHVTLPRVLEVFTPISFNDTDGNTISNGVWFYLRDYSAVYEITVFEQWQRAPYAGLAATNIQPQAFNWVTPFGPGSVPECLHPEVEINGNTASDGTTPAGAGRFYAYITWDFIFPATTPANMNGTTVLEDVQRRHAGGWLRHKESITI